MSCGNRFQCALKKHSRFSFQPDKPSNPELHNENQKRLNDLLKARDDIDKQFFPSNTPKNEVISSITTNITTYTPWNTEANTSFTPWTTPSASNLQAK